MAVELHLPDLPEVPISLGAPRGAPPRVRPPWHLRLRDTLTAYLPLLLMLLLALATWWLVKNTPGAPPLRDETPRPQEPDYTMTQFSVERFGADGKLALRIEGDKMRHYPTDDRIEIDGVRIRAVAPDGRITLANARRAIANGDGSEVQLVGGAEVTSTDAAGSPIVMRGEFLHAFLVAEKVRTHLPVIVQRGAGEIRAAGLDYDHGARRLELKGRMRAVYPPPARR